MRIWIQGHSIKRRSDDERSTILVPLRAVRIGYDSSDSCGSRSHLSCCGQDRRLPDNPGAGEISAYPVMSQMVVGAEKLIVATGSQEVDGSIPFSSKT
jgi:hypothetical protein